MKESRLPRFPHFARLRRWSLPATILILQTTIGAQLVPQRNIYQVPLKCTIEDQLPSSMVWVPAEPDGTLLEVAQIDIEDANSFDANLFNGDFYVDAIDLEIPGRGIDFIWKRTYRSRNDVFGPLGHNWDHSYNIYVESAGADLLLHDGTARSIRFKPAGGNRWTADGEARVIDLQADSSFLLTTRHNSAWSLASLSSSHPGKIEAIVDRNNNSMTFQYDSSGRLERIYDSLYLAGTNARFIDISYNSDGTISQIQDFATDVGESGGGRIVKYEYYTDADSRGSGGDLKSVRSPIVLTSTGNDFPAGKTWVYTYKINAAYPQLNHNLLNVTNPKGQLILTNAYYQGTPTSQKFDRLKKQRVFNPGETQFNYHYDCLTPGAGNNFAKNRTIVNDRYGNVRELYYDSNLLVRVKEFTGRASNPAAVTTGTSNRPVNKLRSTDPAFFATSFDFNEHSRITKVVYPNGAETDRFYDDISSDPRTRLNLLMEKRYPGPLGADQAELCDRWSFDTVYQFETLHINARGFANYWDYDGFGFSGPLLDCAGTLTANKALKASWQGRKGSQGASGASGAAGSSGGNPTTEECPGDVLAATASGSGCYPGCVANTYNVYGQVLTMVDAEGISHRYDYYSSGPMYGYLMAHTIEASPADGGDLTYTFEYGLAGNVTRMTDARSGVRDYEVNALNQVVSVTGPISGYQVDLHYDANDNVSQRDVRNVDHLGNVDPGNPFVTTSLDFDPLNNAIRRTREVDSSKNVVEEYEYDANENLSKHIKGEAVAGSQPNNVVSYVYDERDLLFQGIRGAGFGKSTTQIDYDLNGNAQVRSFGLESSPRNYLYTHDGFDRLWGITDPMGNSVGFAYDENGNRTSTQIQGEIVDTASTAANNVVLYDETYVYDGRDRLYNQYTGHFYYQGSSQVFLPTDPAISQFWFNHNSLPSNIIDANYNSYDFYYDTVSRLSDVYDPRGNHIAIGYDANGNADLLTETDLSDLGLGTQTVTTQVIHDAEDRRLVEVDSAGTTVTFGYDSRDNKVRMLDGEGTETIMVYDGLDRLVAWATDMDGDGASASDSADIVIQQQWDDSSRLIAQTDDNGNTTRYAYDNLDRKIVTRHPDGSLTQIGRNASWPGGASSPDLTSFVNGHDVHDNEGLVTDENGSVVTAFYDLNDRLQGRVITRATTSSGDPVDVLGTTYEIYWHDGLGRTVLAEDDDTRILRGFDSMSNVYLESFQVGTPPASAPAQVVTYSHDAEGNVTTTNYPGGRAVQRTYESLDRVNGISDAQISGLATFDYLGPFLTEQLQRGNGVRTRTAYAYGVATERSVSSITHQANFGAGSTLDQRGYTWDRNGSKLSGTDVLRNRTTTFEIDPAMRMESAIVTQGAGTIRSTSYFLDGANNRTSVVETPFTGFGGTYTMNAGSPEFDFECNQYTQTPEFLQEYDFKGNLIARKDTDAKDLADLIYDYRDQMVLYTDHESTQTHAYAYDCFSRRISKVVDATGAAQETRFIYGGHLGWQVLEEQNSLGTTLASYVYGNYIDELISMRQGPQTVGSDVYFLQDDQFSVTALTNSSGSVLERVDYHDFGDTQFLTAGWTPLPSSLVGNSRTFQGRILDPETGLYYYRSRYMDPTTGRFVNRDMVGTWGDLQERGNAFALLGNQPGTGLDPMGDGWIKRLRNANKIRKAFKKLDKLKDAKKSAEKAAKSLKKNVDEHKKKLCDYLADPDAHDNKGLLKGASPERRKEIIEGRKKALEKQIKKNEGELKKAEDNVKDLDGQIDKVNSDLSVLGVAGAMVAPATTEVIQNGGGVGDYVGAGVRDAVGFVDPGVIDVIEWIFE